METEYEDHGKYDHDAKFGGEEGSMTMDAAAGPENTESPGHDIPMRPGPDLILDERLTSAAAPFLYMLSVVLIAVAGYFVYLFLHG
jgi:hypothetical protein